MTRQKIGWFCTYTPIEILEAAGLEPYGIRADSGMAHEDVYLGDAMCSYVRSCLGGALTGAYDFLDGVVIAHSCECMRRLYDGWEYKKEDIKPVCLHLLDVPRVLTERSITFFANEIERFSQSIQKVYGTISEESLSDAIAESLRTAGLLQAIQDARKQPAPAITGSAMNEIMRKGMRTPRKDFNKELESIAANLVPCAENSGRPRVMVYGGPANPSLIETIEEAGGIVVNEHMCNGIRLIHADEKSESDPYRHLAVSYLSKPPCPRMLGGHNVFGMSRIRSQVREYKVDGIIFFSMKFCSNAQAEWPLFRDMMSEDVAVKALEGDISPDMNIREVQSFVKKLASRNRQHDTGTEG